MIEILEYLAPVFGVVILLALSFFIVKFLKMYLEKYSTERANNSACRRVKWEKRVRNWTDFFWSNSMRFAWITLLLISTVFYSIAIYIRFHIDEGLWISIFFSIVTLLFFLFAYISYINFEKKAKKRLTDFEETIKAAINKEISFEGDNIQVFSNKSDHMDTEEKTFEFPVNVTKIPFPPFEKRPQKKPIVASRKLEFLILSREYFSICQGATAFDLLDPKEGAPAKKCAEVKAHGECEEHYYSQMRNVVYKDDAIQIIFDNEDDNVIFKCPKAAPNRKPAMKALKEKLRITERQRLAKIQEHKNFENIEENKNIVNEGDEEESSDKE